MIGMTQTSKLILNAFLSGLAATASLAAVATESDSSEESVLYAATLQDANGKICPPQGGADGDGGLKYTDPIDLATGGYQLRQRDLYIPGRGLDFSIERTYRSYGGLQARIEGQDDPLDDNDPDPNSIIGNRGVINGLVEMPMGQHWDFNYNMRVSAPLPEFDWSGYDGGPSPQTPDPVFTPPESLVDQLDVMTGDGRVEVFSRYYPTGQQVASSTPANFSNEYFRWRVDYTFGDEHVVITDPSLTQYEFYPIYNYTHSYLNGSTTVTPTSYAGRLKKITDRNGNEVLLSWETSATGVARIDYITDTLQNQIDFVYHDELLNGNASGQVAAGVPVEQREQLIWAIKDPFGRVFEYNYDFTNGGPVLSSVTTPSIENTTDFPLPVEHERFVDGRKWEFEYDNDPELGFWYQGRMIKKVISPNGDVVTENEYEYLTDGLGYFDRNDDRVKRQRYGNAYYVYIVTNTSGNHNLPIGPMAWDDDYYVWVNDRRGAVTRFTYAGANSPNGFHRQLLEKKVYDGFVPQALLDKRVWAVESGESTQWYWLDVTDNALDDDTPQTFGGLIKLDGTAATDSYVWSWETNSNWEITTANLPGGGYQQFDPVRSDAGPGFQTDDPLRWGAVLKSTVSDGNETIVEEWKYDFAHSGAGGGCGCGSVDFATAHKDGRGYVTLKHFDSANGNLLAIYHDMPSSYFTSSIPPANTQDAAAIEEFDYNQYGQVVEHIHPESLVKDDQGNDIAHRRVDRFEYYDNAQADGVNYGRLKRQIIDATPTNAIPGISYKQLATTYEYDAAGNIIREVGPDDDISEYYYNQDSELVREQHFDSSGLKLFAQTDYFYDANGNIVRREVANIVADDATGDPIAASNASLTTINTYDIHDNLEIVCEEAGEFTGSLTYDNERAKRYTAPVSDPAMVSKQYIYDLAKNLVEYAGGIQVAGGLFPNRMFYKYNSRELLVEENHGGDGAAAPLITQYEYDDRARRVAKKVNPSAGVNAQVWTYIYDTFNRVRSETGPTGTLVSYGYDNNHNLTNLEVCGQVDDDAQANSFGMLVRVSGEYDSRDRLTSVSRDIFDYDYSTATPSSYACGAAGSAFTQTTEYHYADSSDLVKVEKQTSDGLLGDVTEYRYDTAGRLDFIQDVYGNTFEGLYDTGSNLTLVSMTDQSTSSLNFEQFELSYEYDALDRVVKTIDGVGNITRSHYDSRSNLIKQVDPRGNITRHSFDGKSRLTATQRSLFDTGYGSGVGIGTITEERVYDKENRLISEKDDNGNLTSYRYDRLNRVTRVTMPDGAFYAVTYDLLGNVDTYTDPRGVTVTNTYDLQNRVTHRSVSGGVPGSTFESFTYDGLGRIRTALNDFAKVERQYDSRFNVVREIQNADSVGGFPAGADREVQYEFDQANNTRHIAYPSGRHVYRTYDDLNRVAGIFKQFNAGTGQYADPITQFEYIGQRVESRVHGNGTRTDYTYNGVSDGNGGVNNGPGDFGFGRMSRILTTNTGSAAVLDEFTFTWDEGQNRTSYNDIGSGMKNRRERAFGYDSVNRVISTDVDFPDPNTDFSSPTNNGITNYVLDGVHNRTSVTGYEGAGAPIGQYSLTGDQYKLNQYSVTPRVDGSSWEYLYDANGNPILKAQSSPVDYNGDYSVNFFDISAFLTAYNSSDPAADYNGDGQVNYFDVSAFTDDYGPAENTDLEHWHYTYDFRNQLIEVSSAFGNVTPTGTTSTYDAMARRVLETTIDQTKQMVYGGVSLWEVLEQIDLSQASEQLLTTHVYGIGIDDEVSYWIEDLELQEFVWAHRDGHNSLTSITDLSGEVKERYEYRLNGEVAYMDPAGNSLGASSFSASNLYAGHLLVAGGGIDYRYRVLSPSVGRFLQRDPLLYVDTMNPYVYASVSPVVFSDPYGLDDIIMPAPNDANSGGNKSGGSLFGGTIGFYLNLLDIANGIPTSPPGSAQDHANRLKSMGEKPDNTYIDGHGGGKNKNAGTRSGGKTGLWFDNPSVPGGYERLNHVLAERIRDNMKKDPCSRDPKLTHYFEVLKDIFDNTNDRVCFFSCNSGAGENGDRLKDALNDLGFETPFRLYNHEVGDPEILWGIATEGVPSHTDSED